MAEREAELHATVTQRTGIDALPGQAGARAGSASARA
jgi:hypothetical protein